MPKYVTRTGRAISPGRTTRASHKVSKTHDGKPLPIHLQCHPKALTPTSHNPQCLTLSPQWGIAFALMDQLGMEDFINGIGLKETGRFSLVHRGTLIVGRTDDIARAIGYKLAAAQHCVPLEVIDNDA